MSKSPLTLTLALSAATLLGYGVYRALSTSGPGAPEQAGHPAAAHTAAELPDTLPAVALADLEGTTRSIDTWAGRPLIINFWATWCAPCLREIPLLKAFQDSRADVRVIGIAVDRPEPVREFAAEMQFNYPILIGQAEAMNAATAFGSEVFVLPFTVFASASGATLGIHAGELHQEHLDDFAATLAGLEAGHLDLAAARDRLAGHR